MTGPIVLSTDGSELSVAALVVGLGLLDPDAPVQIVMVAEGPDPDDLVGAGHVGPAMNREDFDRERADAIEAAEAVLADVAERVARPDADRQVLEGRPGPAICAHAAAVAASAIVLGSRGRSGLRRAVLGSVSDHVVRNAPCTVVVTPPSGVGADGD
jgi:nucleotide-binding universal stress UspA family protein